MGNFKEEIAKIRAFVFDVDGVFTDGSLMVDGKGEFTRTYNAKDGYAVHYALKKGYKVCIITGGKGTSIEARFKILGVTKLHIDCRDKIVKLREFMVEYNLTAEQVMYVGDDLPDRDAMRVVGMPVCPNDAVPEIVEVSRYVSQFDGGKGCVRDVVEQVLRANNDWASDKDDASWYPSA